MAVTKEQIAIFLGPTLPVQEAQSLLDASFHPPIKRGDIEALLKEPPRIIGIIDGEFSQNFSVSPKELLTVLESGITVFGASSMGALRAAELYPFGMIGVGKIFQLYKAGRIDADDEVAMIYAEEEQRPLSVPLVNIRFALQAAAKEGIITIREKQHLLRAMQVTYFPKRCYPLLLQFASDILSEAALQALREYLYFRAPDTKRNDAIRLLNEVRSYAASL
jgi:hypothetical protein